MADTRSIDERLLPCPFCGKSDGISVKIDHNGFGSYRVKCGVCSIQTARYQNREAAVSIWNRRTPSIPAPVAESEEVLTPEQAWLDLCEKGDRTSPEDYPDMCLITKDELADYMSRLRPTQTEKDNG